MRKVIVVGAGAAGLMAAGRAAELGTEVLLLEKNQQVGRKLAITGKGRCNITTAVAPEELQQGYPGNGRFLHGAFSRFNNQDTYRFFEDRGLVLQVERGQRVFPQSGRAEEVVEVLWEYARSAGVRLLRGVTVKKLLVNSADEMRVAGVMTSSGNYYADAVIICTGGLSYPATGSTGDGYRWVESVGHQVVAPRPGLVPLIVEEDWVQRLQGLSLKNVRATAYDNQGKKINEGFGEMLFTHYGLSGPIILSMSRDILDHLPQGKVRMTIDLKPALSLEKLDERLQRDFKQYARRQFNNALSGLLPKKLIPVIIELSGIRPDQLCNAITRAERQALGQCLKSLNLSVYATRSIKEAIVTAGGVRVKEIDPRTMASRLVQGLYLAGEVIDVDGYTGGYNLQAAWSTGRLAGESAADPG